MQNKIEKGQNEPRHKYSIVACARWESPYIVEWLCYHQKIGFDHVFLYCNDDDPAELYEKVLPFLIGDNPFVTFHHFLYQGQQLAMYMHFLKNYKDKTDWILFLDIDEFLRLTRDQTVDRFINSFDDQAEAIYLNWVFFGNNYYPVPPSGSVLKNYLRREDPLGNFMTKTFTKTSIYFPEKFSTKIPNHIWHYLNCLHNFEEIRIVNVLHDDMHNYYFYNNDEDTKIYWKNSEIQRRILAVASINHYAHKSKLSIKLRRSRGLAGEFANQAYLGELAGEWTENAVEDLELSELWNSVLEESRNKCITPIPTFTLLSEGKPATQSSVSAWSRFPAVALDAAGAVDGLITGAAKFHTERDESPWWLVDLLESFYICEVRLFNRMDFKERASHLVIEVDSGDDQWLEVFRKDDDSLFGGVDGYPLICNISSFLFARRVRVRLLEREYLHLNQVQVFGSRVKVW